MTNLEMLLREARAHLAPGGGYLAHMDIDALIVRIDLALRGAVEPREATNADYARIDAAQSQKNR